MIQAGNGHAMLRPAWNRPHPAGLCRILRAAVTTAVPVVRIHALQIERAFHNVRENFVVGKIGREAPQIIQICRGDLLLDLIPVPRPFLQVVGLEADDFYNVLARRRARGIRHTAAHDQQRRILDIDRPARVVVAHAQRAFRSGHRARGYRGNAASRDRKRGRLGGSVVRDE